MDLTPEQHAELAKQREARQRDQISASRHIETQQRLQETPQTIASGVREIIEFLEDNESKTEVTNFPDSFKVPEVADVAQAIVELSRSHDRNKVDTKPILASFKRLEKLLEAIPKEHAEQKAEIKVSNLKELATAFDKLDKSVRNIKMVAEAPNVKVDVPAPIVNLKETDLNPLKLSLDKLIDAVVDKEVPTFEATDTTEVESQLKEANKLLKKIVEKPVGGGGGGGMVSFKDSNDKSIQVTIEADGSVPVTVKGAGGADLLTETTFKARIPTNGQKAKSGSIPVVLASDSDALPVSYTAPNYTTRIDDTSTAGIIYIGNAVIGSLDNAAVWQIKRLDTNTLALDKKWAMGSASFTNKWTERVTPITYS